MTLYSFDQDNITLHQNARFSFFEHFELSPPTSLQIYAQALEPPVFQSRGLKSSGYESFGKLGKTQTSSEKINYRNFNHPFFDDQFWAIEPVHLSWNALSIFRSIPDVKGRKYPNLQTAQTVNFLKFGIGIIGAWTKRVNRIMASLNIWKMICEFYVLHISWHIEISIYLHVYALVT